MPSTVIALGEYFLQTRGSLNYIDISWLESRHGGQCLRRLESRLCLISNAAVLRCCCPRITHGTDGTGSVSVCSAWLVYLECSRVVTKRGLSSHDYFPRDITPPVIPVSLWNYISLMWRVNFTTSQITCLITCLLLYWPKIHRIFINFSLFWHRFRFFLFSSIQNYQFWIYNT